MPGQGRCKIEVASDWTLNVSKGDPWIIEGEVDGTMSVTLSETEVTSCD